MITKFFNKFYTFYITRFLLRGHCGRGCYFHYPVYFYAPHKITIGSNVKIGPFSTLLGQGTIHISDDVLIAANSTISSVGHSISPSDRHLNTFGAVTIEKNVWIGVGAILLQGVNIGTNSIISAGSLVTKSVPSNVIFKNRRFSHHKMISPFL